MVAVVASVPKDYVNAVFVLAQSLNRWFIPLSDCFEDTFIEVDTNVNSLAVVKTSLGNILETRRSAIDSVMPHQAGLSLGNTLHTLLSMCKSALWLHHMENAAFMIICLQFY